MTSDARKRLTEHQAPGGTPAVLAKVKAYLDAITHHRLADSAVLDWAVDQTKAEHHLTVADLRQLLALAGGAR